jgi:cobalt-zinc-cadmium efflux system outer membrane protein
MDMKTRASAMPILFQLAMVGLVLFVPKVGAQKAEETGALSLAQALVLALERHPDLAVYSWDLRAAEARTIQARLRPNPDLSLEIEEIRWGRGPKSMARTTSFGNDGVFRFEEETENGAHSGFSESEVTIALSQLIELGGKRAKRIRFAERDKQLAAWDYEAVRADVLSHVARAFVRALMAQEGLALTEETFALTTRVSETIDARVEAGLVSPLESARAGVELAASRIERDRARRLLDAARAGLAASWGSNRAYFDRAVGRLDEVTPIPALDDLESWISNNPDIARWADEIEQRDAAVALQEANRAPDLTIALGLRTVGLPSNGKSAFGIGSDGIFGMSRTQTRSTEGRDNTFVLEFSLPLPLFHRNQGAIIEAKHRASKALDQQRATRLRVLSRLSERYYLVSADYAEVVALKTDVLTRAAASFEKANEAYRQGAFGYLDVLDAQRTLFGLRVQYLEALGRYHQGVNYLERLVGRGLSPDRNIYGLRSEEEDNDQE